MSNPEVITQRVSTIIYDEGELIASVSKNISQNIIHITEDKLKLCIIEYQNKIEKKGNWLAPFGIFFTIIITLCTTSFSNFAFIDAPTWKAIFIVGGVITFFWLCVSIWVSFKTSVDVSDLIKCIKKSS